MTPPKTQCPDCNSFQRFAPHEREVDDTIETFVRCLVCGYELVIESFPKGERVSRLRQRVHRNRVLRRRVRLP